MYDIPRVLDVSVHNFLTRFAQIADGFRRICAFLAHVFEVNVNPEIFSKTRIFVYTIRVYHVSL